MRIPTEHHISFPNGANEHISLMLFALSIFDQLIIKWGGKNVNDDNAMASEQKHNPAAPCIGIGPYVFVYNNKCVVNCWPIPHYYMIIFCSAFFFNLQYFLWVFITQLTLVAVSITLLYTRRISPHAVAPSLTLLYGALPCKVRLLRTFFQLINKHHGIS